MRYLISFLLLLLLGSMAFAQANADGYDARVDTVEVRFYQIIDAAVTPDTTIKQDSSFTVTFETDSAANPIDPGYTHIGEPIFVKIVNAPEKWASGTFTHALINNFNPGKWDIRARFSYVDTDGLRKATIWSNSTVLQSELNPYFIEPISVLRIRR